MLPALRQLLFNGDAYPDALLAADFVGARTGSPFFKIGGKRSSLFSSSVFPSLTVSRSSVGYAETLGGRLVLFQANEPRITDKGLLVEESRTNLLLRSQEFDNASWTSLGASETANASSAPDGTTTADRLVEDTSVTSQHGVYQDVALSATAYTLAAYFKRTSSTRNGYLRVRDTAFAGTTHGSAVFDLSAGTTSGVTGTAGMTQLANGWWFCWITFTPTAGTRSVIVGMANGTNNFYTGDGSSSLDAWQADLQAGSFPTSPIKTEGASATRGADSVSVAVSQPSALTFIAAAELSAADGIDRRLGVWSDGTANNRLVLTRTSTNVGGAVGIEGGVTRYSQGVTGKTGARVLTVGASHDGSTYRGGVDGAALTSTTAAAPTGLTTLRIGANQDGASVINGYVRRLLVYPRAFSDAELIAATQ